MNLRGVFPSSTNLFVQNYYDGPYLFVPFFATAVDDVDDDDDASSTAVTVATESGEKHSSEMGSKQGRLALLLLCMYSS